VVFILSTPYYTMLGPAKVTAVCDGVAHELNQLRTNDGKNGGGLTIPALRRDAVTLERYVANLGGGVGKPLGFYVFTVRITWTFLCARPSETSCLSDQISCIIVYAAV
jgi:hypothetical protein